MDNLARQSRPLRYTAEDYLRWERDAEVKSEFSNGEIEMMAGGSPRHSLVTMNLGRHLGNALDGSGCRVYSSDLRVRSGQNHYVYPDLTVICGEVEEDGLDAHTATNPRLIVEVLSPSTEQKDRGVKWLRYQHLPTLTDYLLVWQSEPTVEHYARDAAERWRYSSVSGLDAELVLDVWNCRISLRLLYDGVAFDPADDAETVD